MSVNFGNKPIEKFYYGNKAISAIYHGARLVWEAISSCFGAGYWSGSKSWKGTDAWR